MSHAPEDQNISVITPSWWSYWRYFLWLGTFGFGGPIALCGYMQRDLVEDKRWVSKKEFLEGFTLAQICPGPLAAQLAMYLGWLRGKAFGAICVGVAFILPSFLMVIILSVLYVKWGGLIWMQGAFYGIGASVMALIAKSAAKFAKMIIGKDKLLMLIFMVNALVTFFQKTELVWCFILSGLIYLCIKFPPLWLKKPTIHSFAAPLWLTSGLYGAASKSVSVKIFLYFSWAGTFVFGSGLAIIPFLHGGVVNEYHWLSERQFIDAVAVSMITPGPIIITVAFMGYLVAGFLGGLLAAVGAFLPCYLFVVLLAPHYQRITNNVSVRAFVSGVTVAAGGAIAGAVCILGTHSIVDWVTTLIGISTLLLILLFKKIPEPLWIIVAGFIGMFIKGVLSLQY